MLAPTRCDEGVLSPTTPPTSRVGTVGRAFPPHCSPSSKSVHGDDSDPGGRVKHRVALRHASMLSSNLQYSVIALLWFLHELTVIFCLVVANIVIVVLMIVLKPFFLFNTLTSSVTPSNFSGKLIDLIIIRCLYLN